MFELQMHPWPTYLRQAPSLLRPQSFSAGGAELGFLPRSSQRPCSRPWLSHRPGSSGRHKSSSGPRGPCGPAGPPGVSLLPADTPVDEASEKNATKNILTARSFLFSSYVRKEQHHAFIHAIRASTQGIQSYCETHYLTLRTKLTFSSCEKKEMFYQKDCFIFPSFHFYSMNHFVIWWHLAFYDKKNTSFIFDVLFLLQHYAENDKIDLSVFEWKAGGETDSCARVCVCVQSQLLRCLMGSCPERAVCDSPVDTVCLKGLLGCGY